MADSLKTDKPREPDKARYSVSFHADGDSLDDVHGKIERAFKSHSGRKGKRQMKRKSRRG